eukprot:6187415-Pleurochrysis_carterae.AAC.2
MGDRRVSVSNLWCGCARARARACVCTSAWLQACAHAAEHATLACVRVRERASARGGALIMYAPVRAHA